MAELQTQKTGASVADFLAGIENARRRADALVVCDLMQAVTGDAPAMWGPAIIGFGSSRLRYSNGRELDWMQVAFSPRKAALTLYLLPDAPGYESLLARLGKVTTSKACLYIKRLDDIDLGVLRELVALSVRHVREQRFVAV